MLRSMTGFGAAQLEHAGLALRAELRSVNHRHFQLKARLPAEFAGLEPELEALLRQRVERGSFNLSVHAERAGESAGPLVDRALARRYARELRALALELAQETAEVAQAGAAGAGAPWRVTSELDAARLLALPGVVLGSARAELGEGDTRALQTVVGRALDELLEMRTREGAALSTELQRILAQLRALATRIEKRMPQVVRAHKSALHKRVRELLGGDARLAPADLARELALLADRLDVTEELSRLSTHCAHFERLLAAREPSGRRLDFLVQELLREANTIGSKCQDARAAHWVVDLKAGIERLREQVQNAE